MPREFLLPELAESVVEGEIVRWIVAEGESVEEDEPVVEVMTDKVTVELPSPYSGTVQKHLAAEGDVVAVHQPIALFSDDATSSGAAAGTDAGVDAGAGAGAEGGSGAEAGLGAEAGAGAGAVAEAGAVAGTADAQAADSAAEEDDGDRLSLFRPSAPGQEGPAVQVRRKQATGPAGAHAKATGPYGRVLAVPAARRLAREMGVDIESVAGSGPNGRVRVDDVRAQAQGATAGAAGAPAAGGTAAGTAAGARQPASYRSPAGYGELEERVPLRGLRRAISQQMVTSHLQSVRTLHVDEADVSGLVELRSRLKPLAERRGVRLSYLPFIMKAAVSALKAFPVLNTSLDEEKGEIVYKNYFNLGLAVATDNGLVVPVVHDVERKSIVELAQELQDKAARAREGKLASEDVRGGTFSITNIGSLGGLFSFPIINVPEAAILGVHSIKKRPVVLEDDSIVARHMLYLSLAFDHRLVDGAEAAMFTSYLIELIETPESLMLEL